MSRLKIKPELIEMQPEALATDARYMTPVAARDDMTAHQSPALTLQATLEQSWDGRHDRDVAPVARMPFGWTLICMSVVCAAFWYALLRLIFSF